jgi:hypothetical protein
MGARHVQGMPTWFDRWRGEMTKHDETTDPRFEPSAGFPSDPIAMELKAVEVIYRRLMSLPDSARRRVYIDVGDLLAEQSK